MENPAIKFGTDGWRAVIGDDFTFEGVRRVAEGLALYLRGESETRGKPAVIGYDRRFLSREFAAEFAAALEAAGAQAVLSSESVTTPCLAYTAARKKTACGVMITASHNPPHYNGIKFKTSRGASFAKSETDKIEKLIPPRSKTARRLSDTASAGVKREDFVSHYIEKIRGVFRTKDKTLHKFAFAFNPMHGSGAGLLAKALPATKVAEINGGRDPLFGGVNPEPIEKNLAGFARFTAEAALDAGFAVDGDGDRIGIVDDRGRYMAPHIVFPVFLEHLLKRKKMKGCAAQGFALGYLSKRIAADYGVTVKEVPVGFKYVATELEKGGCFIGAEESGGIGFGDFAGYIPERDGLLAALFAAEIMADTGKKLSRIADDLIRKYGESCYARRDVQTTRVAEPETLYAKMQNALSALPKSAGINCLDGVKIIFTDDSWLLIRASGTEPVVRIYCETPDASRTQKLIADTGHILAGIVGK